MCPCDDYTLSSATSGTPSSAWPRWRSCGRCRPARPRDASLPGTRTADEVQAWLEAARHAWAYFFFTERKPSDRAFEDRQIQVRDYYNHAVQQAVTGMFALRGHTMTPPR